MKKLLYLFLLCAMGSIHATDSVSMPTEEAQDEVARVDLLIEATNASLERLKELRVLLEEYKKAEMTALQDPNNTDNLYKLVTLAKEIQDKIDDMALRDYFAPQFIEELKKFAQIAEQKQIPQAR